MLVGSIQFTRTGELSDNTEPRRRRVHRPGAVQVPRDEDPHEEATAELGGKSGALRRQTDAGVCVTADVYHK